MGELVVWRWANHPCVRRLTKGVTRPAFAIPILRIDPICMAL